ncbi:MAG: TIGR00645 family protein [Alphaproteobacteria bacterium]|nr:TIGR00645 family protein [Alphaproteobacteria bacterium]
MTAITAKKSAERVLSVTIFASRWLQAPLYLGLILAQGVYVYHFLVELVHLLAEAKTVTANEIMLVVLGLIDVVMISNLLVMVIIGGYETFVSRLQVGDHRDMPEWLSHVNANTMKIKLALALVGISSIHLLKTFIDIEHLTDRVVIAQVGIHMTFLVSALLMAWTAQISQHISAKD